LLIVERFAGRCLFNLAVHGTDVDAELAGAVGARAGCQIGRCGGAWQQVWNLDVQVVAEQPQQQVVQCHRPRVVAESGEDEGVFGHGDQDCHAVGGSSGMGEHGRVPEGREQPSAAILSAASGQAST
jgi:hypothetical protein